MIDLWFATRALSVGFWQFFAILLLVFGVFLVLAGLFTSYFGSGKSRTIGVGLTVGGLVVALGFAFYYHSSQGFLTDLVWETFLVILAAFIGALAAIGIFLVAIMKS